MLLTDLYHSGKLDLPLLISKMTAEPARVFGLEKAGALTVGNPADVTVLDTEAEWTVDPGAFYTRGTHSPFAGRKLKGRAVLTMVDGRVVMQNGRIVE